VRADEAPQRDLAAAQESEEQEQNCLFIGERGLGFGPSAKLLVDPLQRIGGTRRLPLRKRESDEGKEFVAGLLEAGADRVAAQLPSGTRLPAGASYGSTRRILTLFHFSTNFATLPG